MADYIVKTGNLVKDAELRRAGETYVMTFTIAQNRFFKGKKEARYWDCAMWDDASGRVQKLVNYLPKGSKVTVEGTMDYRDYEKKDGTTGRAYEIKVRGIEFQERRESQPSASAPAAPADDLYDEPIPF